MSFSIENLQPV